MDSSHVAEHIARLKTGDRNRRAHAVEELAAIGVPAVPTLVLALKDEDLSICRNAAITLGAIGDPAAIPNLMDAFTVSGAYVRRAICKALWEIGDLSAAPILIEALTDRDNDVRRIAAEALGEMRASSAILALIEALSDTDRIVRGTVAKALSNMTVTAVLILTEGLKEKNENHRSAAILALGKIGNARTLPRRILADSRSPAQARINALEMLRRVEYRQGNRTVHFTIPDTRTLCDTVLNEDDADARKGAQTVLNWLSGDRELLIGSQVNTAHPKLELLRPAQGGTVETGPDALLIAADEPIGNTTADSVNPTLWQRLFSRRRARRS